MDIPFPDSLGIHAFGAENTEFPVGRNSSRLLRVNLDVRWGLAITWQPRSVLDPITRAWERRHADELRNKSQLPNAALRCTLKPKTKPILRDPTRFRLDGHLSWVACFSTGKELPHPLLVRSENLGLVPDVGRTDAILVSTVRTKSHELVVCRSHSQLDDLLSCLLEYVVLGPSDTRPTSLEVRVWHSPFAEPGLDRMDVAWRRRLVRLPTLSWLTGNRRSVLVPRERGVFCHPYEKFFEKCFVGSVLRLFGRRDVHRDLGAPAVSG